jgi:ornithine cyclodeaminase/alanine dehydrogenase-like protein (mu-crystallin family)
MPDTLRVLEPAIREHGQGVAVNEPRHIVRGKTGAISMLAAAVPGIQTMGFKCYTVSPDGLRFWVMIYGERGEIRAIMEGEHLSTMRTGAASGIATKYMAREESSTVGILGTGYQAPSQLEAVCAVRPIKHVKAFSRTRPHLEEFCTRMSQQLGIAVEPVESAEKAVRDVDVLITITSSQTPVMKGEWLREGTHLNLAGAMKPSSREVDTETLERSNVIAVDDWRQAHDEAGEFIKAAGEGRLDWDRVTELGKIVASPEPLKRSPSDITLFKSHGVGVWDVATAALLLDLARQRGVGIELPIDQPARKLGRGNDPYRLKS